MNFNLTQILNKYTYVLVNYKTHNSILKQKPATTSWNPLIELKFFKCQTYHNFWKSFYHRIHIYKINSYLSFSNNLYAFNSVTNKTENATEIKRHTRGLGSYRGFHRGSAPTEGSSASYWPLSPETNYTPPQSNPQENPNLFLFSTISKTSTASVMWFAEG